MPVKKGSPKKVKQVLEPERPEVRTMVNLTPSQYQRIMDEVARRKPTERKISIAAIVREALEEHFKSK